MPELVVSQKSFTWNTVEMRNVATGKVAYCTKSQGFWLPGFLVYSKKYGNEELAFTIKCRSVLPLTYDVLDVARQDIGVLTLEHWLAPIWRIDVARQSSVSRLFRTRFFPTAEYEVRCGERFICNIRQTPNQWTTEIALRYSVDESSPMSEPLILTLAILLLRPAGGGASG